MACAWSSSSTRHAFGTLAVQAAPLTDVQAWMGHAQVQTTMIYVHYVPQHDAADKLSRVFDTASARMALARVDERA